jgi:hypothetical protein
MVSINQKKEYIAKHETIQDSYRAAELALIGFHGFFFIFSPPLRRGGTFPCTGILIVVL